MFISIFDYPQAVEAITSRANLVLEIVANSFESQENVGQSGYEHQVTAPSNPKTL